MSYDPDFIITIDGQSVTRYVHSWKLTDTEGKEGGSATSTLEVVMKNHDQMLSNKFDIGQSVTIIFGYVGNMGEQVSMTIKKIEEAYSIEEPNDFIKVVGFDAMDDLMGGSLRGGGNQPMKKPPPSVKQK